MQKSARFGLQGRSRGHKSPLLLVVLITITTALSSQSGHGADDPGVCTPAIGKVVSLQGRIEVLRSGAAVWATVTRLDSPVCAGDRLRAGAASRAAIFIQPESIIRLDQNTELSVSQSEKETAIEFFQDSLAVSPQTVSEGCGAGYVITRFPKTFRIRTPHLNAAVEGTEFLVAMRCESTELAVFEGQVRAQAIGSAEELLLTARQSVTAGPAEPAAIKVLVKPTDAVQWALYYPPLSDVSVVIPTADECAQLPAGAIRQTCYAQRAESLLRVGRVEQAESEIALALADPTPSADALAIEAIINVAKNDKPGALSAAQQAIDLAPKSARAWLALSYAQQAMFKLEDATKSVQRATELAPDSSLAQSRLAELLMSTGRIRDAEKAARRATEISPKEARAHMVLGFAYLAKIDTKRAKVAFATAINLDSSEPLSRLGFGLAEIRDGKLKVGREQLEIAAALDPQNSLLRSYLGKAYYEEHLKARDELALTQFELAKQLDPRDPTPWFYEAILTQSQNRPVDALQSLQRSIDLNENRAVYRSTLLLEQDVATQGISVARTYLDLGLQPVALLEAARSIASDPSNYSAHRFMADAYSVLPRHEIARQSELLQAKLRQPASTATAQPLGNDLRAFSLVTSSAFSSMPYEYGSLFSRDGPGAFIRGLTGSHGTNGNQIDVIGSTGIFGGAIRHYRFETNGFRDNNDYLDEAYGLEVQYQATAQSKLQLEARHRETASGDLPLRFDSNDFFDFRSSDSVNQFRVGAWLGLSPDVELLVTGSYQDRTASTAIPSSSFELIEDDITESLETQTTFSGVAISATVGAGYYQIEGPISVNGSALPSTRSDHSNGYIYSTWHPDQMLYVTIGLAADESNNVGIKNRQMSPKFGVIWTPNRNTTLRFGAFRTFRRNLVARATIEPTQIAGFNQFFDDPSDADSKFVGVGIDQRVGRDSWIGVSTVTREIEFPRINFDSTISKFEWRENISQVYWYYALSKNLVTSLDYAYEELERPEDEAGFDGIIHSRTQIATAGMSGVRGRFSAHINASIAKQNGDFLSTSFVRYDGSSRPTTIDLGCAYLLPNRLGSASLDVRNLFDRRYDFQDIDPTNPRLAPERLVQIRLTVSI